MIFDPYDLTYFSLWNILFENDLVSQWIADYCISNDECKNDKLRSLISTYGRSSSMANSRLSILDTSLKEMAES